MKNLPGPLRFVALAAIVLVAGCGKGGHQDQLQAARKSLEGGDTAAAIVQLKDALQAEPSSGEARLLLGRVLLGSGDAGSAILELNKAQELKVPKVQVAPDIARALLAQRQFKKITDEFGGAVLGDARADADLGATLANAHAMQGQSQAAEAVLANVLKQDPGNADALVLRARVLASQGQLEEAIKVLDKVVALQPKNALASAVKGNIQYLGLGDVAGATASYRAALAASPDDMVSHSALIAIHIASRDIPAAEKQFAEMRKLLPNAPQTKYVEAQLAFVHEDYRAARDAVQMLLKFDPEQVRVLHLGAAVDLALGELRQAETKLQKVLQAQPSSANARKLLAQVYLRTGASEKALATLAPIIEAEGADADSLSAAAEAYLLRNDLPKAEAAYVRAAKVDPKNAKVLTAIALMQLSKGRADTAFAELEKVAAGDVSTVADMALITTRLRRGELDSAMVAVDALDRKTPGKPTSSHLRGRILIQKKDLAGARASFDKAVQIAPTYLPAVAALADLDMAAGKPDEALKRFETLLKLDPRNTAARLAIVELRAKAGASKDEIFKLLNEAVRVSPGDPLARLYLIDRYLSAGDVKSAQAAAQEASVAFPEDPAVLDGLGRSFMVSGDYQQAVSVFRRLASLQPKSAVPHMRLADVYSNQRNYDAAMAALKRALELSSETVEIQRRMITLALQNQRVPQALDIARSVQKQQPANAMGHVFEGEIEAKQKNWPAAIAAYRVALTKEPTANKLAAVQHRLMLTAGQTAQAEAFSVEWIKKYPRDTGFLQYLADKAMSSNDLPKAEQRYRDVLAIQPNSAYALNNLAWVMLSQGKPGALEYAERAVKFAPDAAPFLDTLAQAQSANGQAGRAVESAKRALELVPGQSAFRFSLAKLYLKNGQKNEAKLELEQLATLGDKFGSQTEVGSLLRSLGN